MTKSKNNPKSSSRKAKSADVQNSRAFERDLKAAQKAREKQFKADQKQFLKDLKPLEKFGIYTPKDTRLTKYRAKRVRKAYAEFADQLNPANFLFVKPPTKKRRQTLKKTATLPDVFKNTKEGFFVPREGYKKATVKQSTKTGDLYVKRTGKVETGKTARRETSSVIPIVSIDELDLFRNKVENAKQELGPLKEGEVYYFIVHDVEGKSRSRNVYSDLDLLMDQFKGASSAKALGDPALKPHFLNAMRHLEIRKSKLSRWVAENQKLEEKREITKLKRRKIRRANKTGR